MIASSPLTAPPAPRRLPTAVAVAAALLLNAVLGLIAFYPYLFTVRLLNGVAGALGWGEPTTIFRDGAVVPVLFVVALWAVFVPVVVLANRAVRRRTTATGRRYWAVSLVLLALPSVVAAMRFGLRFTD